MREYLHDRGGFFRADAFAQTGEKFRPLDVLQGTLVFDSRFEEARRADHRQRVEQWNRKLGTHTPRNPFPRKMR